MVNVEIHNNKSKRHNKKINTCTTINKNLANDLSTSQQRNKRNSLSESKSDVEEKKIKINKCSVCQQNILIWWSMGCQKMSESLQNQDFLPPSPEHSSHSA